jgi:hypothetical protein
MRYSGDGNGGGCRGDVGGGGGGGGCRGGGGGGWERAGNERRHSQAVIPAANAKCKVCFLDARNPVTRKHERVVPSLAVEEHV